MNETRKRLRQVDRRPLQQPMDLLEREVLDELIAQPNCVPVNVTDDRPRVGSWVPPELLRRGGKKHCWITSPSDHFASTPYLPLGESDVPRLEFASPQPSLPGPGVRRETERISTELERAGQIKLAAMFRKCFPNTLETTVRMLADGGAYVITGDIDLMWLRDSSAQVHPYLLLPGLREDPTVIRVVEGLIQVRPGTPLVMSAKLLYSNLSASCKCISCRTIRTVRVFAPRFVPIHPATTACPSFTSPRLEMLTFLCTILNWIHCVTRSG